MQEVMGLCFLTFAASAVGTSVGFGISTFMIPVMFLIAPPGEALLFVGIIHLCGDIWKIILFRRGVKWKLIIAFGFSGIAASYLGASLTFQVEAALLRRVLGLFMIVYVLYLFFKPGWKLPDTTAMAVSGGVLSGLFAGFFGVGGAVRGAFLVAFDLPKEVYIFTSGLVALFIDLTRISRYLWGGARLEANLLAAVIFCIPVSFAGAYFARRFLNRVPQKSFRAFVSAFILVVAVILIAFG